MECVELFRTVIEIMNRLDFDKYRSLLLFVCLQVRPTSTSTRQLLRGVEPTSRERLQALRHDFGTLPTNNSPIPMSMRIPRRKTLPDGVPSGMVPGPIPV